MQVNSINSTSFGKNGYFVEMTKEDIKDLESFNKTLKKYNDIQNINHTNSEGEPQRKGIIATLLSIAVGGAVIFAASKKGYRSVSSVVSTVTKKISQKGSVQNFAGAVKNLANSYKLTSNISKTLSSAKDKVTNSIVGEFAKKAGAENIFAGATTLGVTARVLKEDGNENGIPDIMERGVNAYKNVLKEADLAKEVIDTLS